MKIGLKLGLGFAVAIIGLIVCVFMGMNATRDVNDMLNTLADKRYPAVSIVNKCVDASNKIEIDLLRMFVSRANPEGLSKIKVEVKSEFELMDSLLKSNDQYVITEKGRKHYNDLIQKVDNLTTVSLQYVALLDKTVAEGGTVPGSTATENLRSYLQKDVTEATANVAQSSTEYANFLDTAVFALARDSDVIYDDVFTRLIVIAIICVLIALLLATIITLGITKPLNKAVEAARKVSIGDFNVDLKIDSKDEVGIMVGALEDMIKSINNVITDTNILTQAATNGQLEVRADVKKHQGAYSELVAGINGTLDAVIGPLNMTAEYVDRISKGDMPAKITDHYPGDYNEIKNNINGCISSIESLVAEINTLINSAIEGKLDVRGKAERHSGDFQKVVRGMNELIDAFVDPINTMAVFLEDVSNGNTGMQKVTKEYKGDFNVAKNNINKTHDILFGFLGGIQVLTVAANAGNLEERIDVTKYQGGWAGIIGGINAMFEVFSSLMNDVGGVLGVMATGDLTPRVINQYKGKFDEMKNNINGLGDSLTDLISQLQTAIHTTASASAQISATAETLAAATQEQSSQTDEVASAVEEMSRTVTDNAQSATKTSDVAKQSGVMANEGGQVVNQTVAKMREIADVVKTSAENITKLGESSKKIGEIISVIDDIADQTNLLALNAAIEAARAGEQGRGFAVVADEVRKLAESTAGATKQIADMIKGIQSDTDLAVVAMQKGTDEVQSGIELADKAGMSLQDILSSINELLDMINQIAAASEEQSATSEQISKNVSTISKVTADSARNIEDVAHTASELAHMTDTLTSLVSQFKVHDDNGGRRGLGGYNHRTLN